MSSLLFAEVVNHPVVNIYAQTEANTKLSSQAIFGHAVQLVQKSENWSQIKTPDGLVGWVESAYLASNPAYEEQTLASVCSLFANIYRVRETMDYPPIMTIPFGSKVKINEGVVTDGRWTSIELPSGDWGWIQNGDIETTTCFKTLDEVLTISKKFLGLPFAWGGISTYGFDCSGFIQTLFREMGIQLPRNTRNQAKCDLFVPVLNLKEEMQPGDLLFFGTNSIYHSGIYLGDGKFIHSSVTDTPNVQITDLDTYIHCLQAVRRIDPNKLESYRKRFR